MLAQLDPFAGDRALDADALGPDRMPSVPSWLAASPLASELFDEPSRPVDDLRAAVSRVVREDPTQVPEAVALSDAQAVLTAIRDPRVHALDRLADVEARGLQTEFRSTGDWLRAHQPDAEVGDVLLARKLQHFSFLKQRLAQGALPMVSAKRVARHLLKVRWHVDQDDGLIDGHPGDQVVAAVVGHVAGVASRILGGLPDGDPLLERLIARTSEILYDVPGDLPRLERAFTLLAEHVPPPLLNDALDTLVCALLPSQLEKRAEQGEERAHVMLERRPDGAGWHVEGDLDLECGELLYVALSAEARRDEANPLDTAAAEALRAAGLDPSSEDVGERPRPRRKARRLHDALKRLLQRYVDADLGGITDKQPVRVSVTVSADQLDLTSGALPAVADSGARLPRRLLQRWWCSVATTAFVISRGWIPLGVQHTGRTLTATERRALDLRGGHRCAGLGCCAGRTDDPTVTLEPHHIQAYASSGITSLPDSIWVCPTLHHDLHRDRTVTLRNGRKLRESGWV